MGVKEILSLCYLGTQGQLRLNGHFKMEEGILDLLVCNVILCANLLVAVCDDWVNGG